MEKIKVLFKGQEHEFPKGITIGEIFENLNVKGAIGAVVKPLEEINKEEHKEELLADSKASESGIFDIHTPLTFSAEIKPIYKGSKEGLEIMRHTLAHILAQALSEIYGREKVHLGIGPTTENGFFYDVEVEGVHLKEEDLPKIEEKMREIVKRDLPIERIELSREEAKKLFSELGEKYKLQIIDRIPEGQPITIYKQGDFVDLCRGPHLPSTGKVGEFKLSHIAGAYWMGRSDQPMLQRIYGVAFWTKKDLKNYLNFLEEVKKRDHRKLGKELEFFTIDQNIGAGLILWLPRGALYRKLLEDFLREEHYKRGYEFVYTPHVGKSVLWETSGHLEFYKENMFPPMEMDNETYYVKPMNCPFHIAIYKSKVRSYKELPIRFFELGTVYRYELSGVLHGLLRVRGFTQDDAHIICTEEQVGDEIKKALRFALDILKVFGFEEYKIYISTRPEKSVGSDRQWEVATNALIKAVEELGLDYEYDEGGGAFYGPKIDIKVKDAIGRFWQLSTIQFDFNLPERFDMTYIGPDNKPHRPYMVHRAVLGSIERFTGVLLEHTAGLLPLWIAPTQVIVLPIADRHNEYALKVAETLKREGFRVEVDLSEESLGAKIRKAELLKIPYMLVVGDKEAESGTVSVRGKKEGKNLGTMSVEEFVEFLRKRVGEELGVLSQ